SLSLFILSARYLAQGMAAVLCIRPHLPGPAADLDRLRARTAGEHFGALQLVDRTEFGLVLEDDALDLAADGQLERLQREAVHREAARHLQQLWHVLGVVDLVEQRFLVGINVHRRGEQELRLRMHGDLPFDLRIYT